MIGGFCFAALVSGLVAFAISAPEDFRLAVAKVASFIVTPFVLEPLLFITFFCVVVVINRWRRKRDGDEWVYMMDGEVVSDPNQVKGVHDAVFTDPPESANQSVDLEVIEGLVSIGSFDEAAAEISRLPDAIRESRDGLRVRLALAEKSGKKELAERLKRQLENLPSD